MITLYISVRTMDCTCWKRTPNWCTVRGQLVWRPCGKCAGAIVLKFPLDLSIHTTSNRSWDTCCRTTTQSQYMYIFSFFELLVYTETAPSMSLVTSALLPQRYLYILYLLWLGQFQITFCSCEKFHKFLSEECQLLMI